MTDDLSRAEIAAGVTELLGYRLFCADERCSCVTERERFECICDPPEVVVAAILAAATRVREERGFVTVPKEPTGAMVDAADEFLFTNSDVDDRCWVAAQAYRVMLGSLIDRSNPVPRHAPGEPEGSDRAAASQQRTADDAR